jgi:hypothetical protein
MLIVLGDCVAENRGADFVKHRDYVMLNNHIKKGER